MVLSFMSQLSVQRRGQEGEMETNSGIRLHLVDRKKDNVEGFAFAQPVDDVGVH